MHDLTLYYSYFEKYKIGNVLTVHYVDVFELGETLTKIKSQGDGFHLAVEDPSVPTTGNNFDNAIDRFIGAVVVLGKLTMRKDKVADRNKLLADTFTIAQAIKKQMMTDSALGCGLLRDLQFKAFELDKVGPLGESLYGWRLQFEFLQTL